ncbi:HAUS augmin-like complex subunit 6 N-terminus-domain-containing protein [Lophiotrema nucula]|uniref:HAUS augmin-like complex subunit 6 N-terminus-domain-containing protein n=1 Tax=Lophiotrema nucula TaxID=690887 RepID=A0A6A5Z371_9PLEO|nr:HAUS augmin-like complex subunit 6 N-terminus-domain-containing protein [Lophiotrema nucula]
MSRSTSQSSTTTTTTTNGLSRSLSVKTNTKPAANSASGPISDVKLFVTNLRLLDLDLRSDWPGIIVQTFSSRNADQKQRISGVEWSLFRLFEIWDPAETSQKLQPFFPPLEPLQSLNLRAALYRCLNELKKNGVLGREAVLRKTMLDECKGDKFFEVLSLFSTAVLKKVLAGRRDNPRKQAVTRRLATATTLPTDQQASLLPLAIAHKAALVNVLRRKEEKRNRYAQFATLLDAKLEEINSRNKKCLATPRSKKPTIPQAEAAAIKKQLQDHWIGNQKWLETMLHGDDAAMEDAFLQKPFKEVWHLIENGRKPQEVDPDIGLLENLQSRVEEQRSRLAKWQSFHNSLRNGSSKSNTLETRSQVPAKEFKFDNHVDLQLPSTAPDNEPTSQESLRSAYQDILSDMDEQLWRASNARYNRSVAPVMQRRGSSFSHSRSPARRKKSQPECLPKKPSFSATEKPPVQTSPLKKQSKDRIRSQAPPPLPVTTPMDSEATLVANASNTVRTEVVGDPQRSSLGVSETSVGYTSDTLPAADSSPSSPTPQAPDPRSPSPQPPSYFPSEPPILEPPPQSHEEALADQIISSMDTATPSPTKKQPRMSLLERTRMSMARNSNFPPITESPPSESTPLPELPNQGGAQLDPRASLLERTRLSMAAMSQNPRQSQQSKNEKRKSSARQSLFPINQFDTPRNRKSIAVIEEQRSGDRTPKEELFSDDVDYDKVFKSRPRVAQSPIFSPSVANAAEDDDDEDADDGDFSGLGVDDYDEGVTGVDLDDVDADEDAEGFTQAWENSPLRRAGAGLKGKNGLF